jgi:hypothetical protein
MAKNTIRSMAKMGFGLGIGVMAAQIVFILVGAAIFIPGYLMLEDTKKDPQGPSEAKRITGLVLMGIGVLIMGGVGFGFLMENIGESF